MTLPDNDLSKWLAKIEKTPAIAKVEQTGTFALRPAQRPPTGRDWLTWLLIGGRGSGKTRAGSEWVHALATGLPMAGPGPVTPIALVGETYNAVRDVMIDGPAGLLACARIERPHYEVSRRRLVWPNGSVAQVFSAQEPESLRGPQFAAAWCDELAKWPDPQAVWDMLQFGLRFGQWPRQLVTTTPRPIELLRQILADQRTAVSRMRTIDNKANLAEPFLATIMDRYGGTALGRQELDGEFIEQREGALWARALLDRMRVGAPPELKRIVVALDPPTTSKKTSDGCGIIAAGLGDDGQAYVLGDHSLMQATPTQWATKACLVYEALGADCLVAETNQGGEMVTSVIATINPSVPVKMVHARQSKFARAEPIAALYEQGRVHHCGPWHALEDEMCDFSIHGLSTGKSPDRLDALVWAIGHLLGASGATPRVRTIR